MDSQTKAPPAAASSDCEDLSLAKTMGAKYSLSPARFVETLRKTYFAVKGGILSKEEIAAALAICQRYDLDPFLREVHCTRNGDRLMIMVGIDGWTKMAQRTGLCGIDAPEVEMDDKGRCTAVTVGVHRKDWERPIRWTAYMAEWRKDSPTWNAQPVHMLTIKALKLALRFGFSVGGGLDLEDPDELGAPDGNGAGHTMAPGVRSSRPLPEAVTPRPAAARTAGGTAAPEAPPAGGGGTVRTLAAGEDIPWDADDADDEAPTFQNAQEGGQAAPPSPDEPGPHMPAQNTPAAAPTRGKANGREAVIEAVRDLEGKLSAAGVVIHVSGRDELEELSEKELEIRATMLRGELFKTKRPAKPK